MTAPLLVRRVRQMARNQVSRHPAVYLPIARRRYPGPSPEVIGPGTELVIDGYTRSATTFAVYALQLPQPKPVRLAHHLHAPAQLIEAAQRRVPTIALIRQPEGAVLSHLAREPWVDMRDASDGFALFYESLMPYKEHFVIGEFEQVTNDFAGVVRRLNARFGLTLAEFEPTQDNLDLCRELIKERPLLSPVLLGFESGTVSLPELQQHRREGGGAYGGSAQGPDGVDLNSWLPSTGRSQVKDALRKRWHEPSMRKRRLAAEAAYDAFVSA
jgi:hypothetical protein